MLNVKGLIPKHIASSQCHKQRHDSVDYGYYIHEDKSNILLNITWQIYSFAKSQNQMSSEKIGLLQQFAIWTWQIKN
jgi:hypothetical protein